MTRTTLARTALCFLVLIGAGVALAGPINPPAGPIASTAKPLSEVEPRTAINATNTPGDATSLFKIVAPGSYYLTGNITGVVGKHGIAIAASGVTLDLNGFDLAGVPAMGAFDGVSVTVNNLTNIAVVNGSVRNWGDEGVDLGSFSVSNGRVEGVCASGNTGNGIGAGNGCTLTNCSATANALAGINTSNGCALTNCSARSNTGNGIGTSFVCTLTNCSATTNGGVGFTTSTGCTLTNCSADTNTGNGISTGVGCTVSSCTVSNNTGTGITTGTGCTISICSAHVNTGNGISTGLGCTVSNCSAYQNTGNGISVSSGSTVADCTARVNTLDGIVCSSQCVIRGNTCSLNGLGTSIGAGIHATNVDNRIEGNNCTGADRGIDVDLSGNIIIRNTCVGNTIDWVIVANNVVGPILDRRAPASAAINGFSFAGSLGTTDPNANFSY